MSGDTLTDKKDSTIRQILDAAATVFADKGFAGARVDEIADKAGVNKATIYYHIGDKQVLYARVLHDVFGVTADDIEKNIHEKQTPEEKIVAYAKAIAQTVRRYPNIPRIMMYEAASGIQNFPDEAAKDLVRMFVKLTEILEEGVDKGVFDKVNPFLVHFLAVGPLIFYTNLNVLKERYVSLPGADRLEKYLFQNVGEEIEKIILKAVMK
jgi:TetR/AcrR family transcriptional regulator